MSQNFSYALPPHSLPVILSATSELAKYPRENVLLLTKPDRPWRTGANDADQVLQMDGFDGVTAVLLANVNYANILLEKSTNQSTWLAATPNILRNSDAPTLWTQAGGTVTRTDNFAQGPLSADRLSGRALWQTANATIASTSTGLSGESVANRDYYGSVWLRTRLTGVSHTIQLTLRFTGVGDSFQSFTVTDQWQRFGVQRNAGGSATGASAQLVLRGPVGNEDVLLLGAQVTQDVTVHVGADYKTVADDSDLHGTQCAIVIRKDARRSRRNVLLRFGASLGGYRYFRLRIFPDQTTDDGENYSTGALLKTSALQTLPGRHQFPFVVQVTQASRRTEFESGGVEMLRLGDQKVILTVRGVHIVRDAEAALLGLVGAGPHQPILISEDIRPAGRGQDAVDESRAYLTFLSSGLASSMDLPEAMSADLTFEEII